MLKNSHGIFVSNAERRGQGSGPEKSGWTDTRKFCCFSGMGGTINTRTNLIWVWVAPNQYPTFGYHMGAQMGMGR